MAELENQGTNRDLAQQYFYSVALAVKVVLSHSLLPLPQLNYLLSGRPCNVDMYTLLQEAEQENLPFHRYPQWLSERVSQLTP